MEISVDKIRLKAYLLWENAGYPLSDGVSFWLEAEQQLKEESDKLVLSKHAFWRFQKRIGLATDKEILSIIDTPKTRSIVDRLGEVKMTFPWRNKRFKVVIRDRAVITVWDIRKKVKV